MVSEMRILRPVQEGEKMTSGRTDPYEGLETYSVELGLCGICRYFMVENVDYPVFIRNDNKEFRIPEGYMPPVMFCIAKGKIRSCCRSETCPDYRGVEE